jgi:hypothetical protein
MRAKKLPRLWCALQGLLPLEQCLAAQEGELAWPRSAVAGTGGAGGDPGDGAATGGASRTATERVHARKDQR